MSTDPPQPPSKPQSVVSHVASCSSVPADPRLRRPLHLRHKATRTSPHGLLRAGRSMCCWDTFADVLEEAVTSAGLTFVHRTSVRHPATMRETVRRGVVCTVASVFVMPVLLGTLIVITATLRALAAGVTQQMASAEPRLLLPVAQHPHVPTVHIDFGQSGEHFDEGMSQILGIVSGQIDIDAAAARPAKPADREAVSAQQTGHAQRRQLDTIALPQLLDPEEMPVEDAAPAEADQIFSAQEVCERPQNHDPAAGSPAVVPRRRQRAPPVRTTGKRVPSERCQWLSDTVDDSMRWFLHEERLSIDDEQPFPRMWCAQHCCSG